MLFIIGRGEEGMLPILIVTVETIAIVRRPYRVDEFENKILLQI